MRADGGRPAGYAKPCASVKTNHCPNCWVAEGWCFRGWFKPTPSRQAESGVRDPTYLLGGGGGAGGKWGSRGCGRRATHTDVENRPAPGPQGLVLCPVSRSPPTSISRPAAGKGVGIVVEVRDWQDDEGGEDEFVFDAL